MGTNYNIVDSYGGSQSTGSAQGTQNMSGADQFAKIGSGLQGVGKFLFG